MSVRTTLGYLDQLQRLSDVASSRISEPSSAENDQIIVEAFRHIALVQNRLKDKRLTKDEQNILAQRVQVIESIRGVYQSRHLEKEGSSNNIKNLDDLLSLARLSHQALLLTSKPPGLDLKEEIAQIFAQIEGARGQLAHRTLPGAEREIFIRDVNEIGRITHRYHYNLSVVRDVAKFSNDCLLLQRTGYNNVDNQCSSFIRDVDFYVDQLDFTLLTEATQKNLSRLALQMTEMRDLVSMKEESLHSVSSEVSSVEEPALAETPIPSRLNLAPQASPGRLSFFGRWFGTL